MINYLLDNRLLHAKQYGFIKGRSTSLQLLHIMDKWTEYLEQGGQIEFEVFHVHSYQDQFIQPGWAECFVDLA